MAHIIDDDVKRDASSSENQQVEQIDEKPRSFEALEAQHVDDEAEAQRVLKKVDYRLVPMLALLYLVSFIDRSNSTSSPHVCLRKGYVLIMNSRQCEDCRHDRGSQYAC